MRDRVLPPQRPPALPIPRRKLTRVEFAQLMLDQDGRCAACREKLRADLLKAAQVEQALLIGEPLLGKTEADFLRTGGSPGARAP